MLSLTGLPALAYEKKYRAKKDADNIIQLIVKGSQLITKQLWSWKEIVVAPLSDLYFYNTTESYSLQFVPLSGNPSLAPAGRHAT